MPHRATGRGKGCGCRSGGLIFAALIEYASLEHYR